MLQSRDMVGTAYIDQYPVDKTPDHLSLSQITDLHGLGWEIGAYTGVNMLKSFGDDATAAGQKLQTIVEGMKALGFPATTLAAGGRGWSSQLADIARPLFRGVRVAHSMDSFETYPIADPCYINGGGRPSLFAGTTIAEVCDDIRGAIACGGLLIEVVHKVGATGDDFTVTTPVFAGILDFAKSEMDSGRLRVCTLEQALTPTA
jgi:hypothetical protein